MLRDVAKQPAFDPVRYRSLRLDTRGGRFRDDSGCSSVALRQGGTLGRCTTCAPRQSVPRGATARAGARENARRARYLVISALHVAESVRLRPQLDFRAILGEWTLQNVDELNSRRALRRRLPKRHPSPPPSSRSARRRSSETAGFRSSSRPVATFRHARWTIGRRFTEGASSPSTAGKRGPNLHEP